MSQGRNMSIKVKKSLEEHAPGELEAPLWICFTLVCVFFIFYDFLDFFRRFFLLEKKSGEDFLVLRTRKFSEFFAGFFFEQKKSVTKNQKNTKSNTHIDIIE